MHTRHLLTASVIAFATVTTATAQPGAVRVRGLLHQPLGTAVLTPSSDGRVAVDNLGSSGQDGVRVDLHSAWGGGMSVDISPMLGATGVAREIRMSPEGWDGTIKGTMRLISSPTGALTEEYDYSPINPAGLHWRLLDETGQVLAEGDHPGPIISWGLVVDAPAGGAAVDKIYSVARSAGGGGGGAGGGAGSAMRDAEQGFFDIACTVSGLTPAPISGVQMIEVTPEPCAGLPENCPPGWTNLQSLSLTADGLSSLTVGNAHLGTFDLHCWGLGDTHVGEVCDDGDCDDEDSGLIVTNIGSSGQDGVAIDLGRSSASGSTGGGGGGAGGVTLRSKRCPDCPPGHVTLIKVYDEPGSEMRLMQTLTDPLSGDTTMEADFSDIGATGYVVRLFGPGGTVIGPPEGTAFINGGSPPIWHPSCPGGARARYINVGTASNPVWQFDGCETIETSFTLPGGVTYGGVVMMQMEALNPTSSYGPMRQLEVTASNTSSLTVEDLHVTGLLSADADCSGTVDFFDIDPFLQVLFNPREYSLEHVACSTANSDCNRDGTVDFFDIDPFLACMFGSCP